MDAISGNILNEVEVHFLSSGDSPQTYFISLMKAVTIKKIKSMEEDDEEGGDITQDRIVLLPESLKLTYIVYDNTGAQTAIYVEELNCSN